MVYFMTSAAESARSIWMDFAQQSGVSIIKYGEEQKGASEVTLAASFGLSEARAQEMTALGQKFAALPGVINTEWSQATETEAE